MGNCPLVKPAVLKSRIENRPGVQWTGRYAGPAARIIAMSGGMLFGNTASALSRHPRISDSPE